MILGIIAVLLYGMLSEIVKLNRYWNGNYNLLYELTNFQSYIDFGANQFYRIFGIWTELGGNIIDFVHKNGFFYGITYVKFLAPYHLHSLVFFILYSEKTALSIQKPANKTIGI